MIDQSNLNSERGIANGDLFLCKVYVEGVLVSQNGSQSKQVVLSQLFSVP